MKHASAKNIIEMCFGMLKMRWAILRSASYYPIRTQNRIIIACCLLHNFIPRDMAVDPIEDDSNLEDALENQPPMGREIILLRLLRHLTSRLSCGIHLQCNCTTIGWPMEGLNKDSFVFFCSMIVFYFALLLNHLNL
ncbi:hypothetical protein ACSBR1_039928 [Camellia fascicularis]